MKHSLPPQAHERCGAFTLIEMLVVIAIIAALSSILVGAVVRSIEKGDRLTALADVKSIEGAVMLYYEEYGKLPIKDNDHGAGDNTGIPFYPGSNYPVFVLRVLKGLEGGFPDNNGYGLNPKKITFLDTKEGSGDDELLDPWGTQYELILDRNYDDRIQYPSGTEHRAKVLVISAGPDKDFSTQEDNIGNVVLEP